MTATTATTTMTGTATAGKQAGPAPSLSPASQLLGKSKKRCLHRRRRARFSN